MSTDLKDITIYYNTFDVSKKNSNGKNPTNYVDMYDMPEFKNSLFIYTANETNSGPGNTKYNGGGTALVAKKERAFGIITGYAGSTGKDGEQYAINNKYKVIYQFNDKAQKYITNKPTNTEQKTVLNHIADQITMLGKFIIGWNNDVAINDNKITNIILPLTKDTEGNLILGVDIFKNYVTIAVVGEYWLNSVLKLFNKTNNNLKPALDLLEQRSSAVTSRVPFSFNPNAKEFTHNANTAEAEASATGETPTWGSLAEAEAEAEAAGVPAASISINHQPSPKANKTKKSNKANDFNNNEDYNKYKLIYTENYNKYLTNKKKHLKEYKNFDLITYLNNLYNAINAYNYINNYLLKKYKTVNDIKTKDTKFYTIYNKINSINTKIRNILDYIINQKLFINDDIKKYNHIITDNHSNNNDMLLYSRVYIKHINNVQNLNLILILRYTLLTLYAKNQENHTNPTKNNSILTQLNVNGYHICRYLLSLNKYSNIYNNDMLYININDMNNYIKNHLNNILNRKINTQKNSEIIQNLSNKAKKSAEDAKKAQAEANVEAEAPPESQAEAQAEAPPEAEAEAEAEAQPNEKKTKKAAKQAQPGVAKNNLKQLLQDDTDNAENLFNELITLLNTDGITHNNILELKNKDNNTLLTFETPIISQKPFSAPKNKENCEFKTLFDILIDDAKFDNICTSVNLTNLQTSVYHFSQLINNFHKYIDDKYIKIENGNIVITKDAIVKYFDKKQSESRNTNLINIYKALSQNINFSLNINMFNILKIKYLRPFFNTVINTKYFTLLQADNDIYKLYNSVITHKHNTKLDTKKLKHFKYLYSIIDLINENDNIKSLIISKYNSPSESEPTSHKPKSTRSASRKPEEPRRSEEPRSAKPKAPKAPDSKTIKKLKKKIAFVNI